MTSKRSGCMHVSSSPSAISALISWLFGAIEPV